jgi:hypothetical protein
MKQNDNENEERQKTAETVSLDSAQRVLAVPTPAETISFSEWRAVINDNFPDLLFAAEIGLSIIAQILSRMLQTPLLGLVDVPSAGKTSLLTFSRRSRGLRTQQINLHLLRLFQMPPMSKRKSSKKSIYCPTTIQTVPYQRLATLFSKRDDDLNECLGILTRVLDGEGFNTDSGIHGQRQYVGEYLFMVLAASTPIPPRVWKMMGNLGSRLFFLNMNSKDKSEDELAEQLGSTAYKTKEKAAKPSLNSYLKRSGLNTLRVLIGITPR